ncbi:gp30 [Rhodococcus phage ReqiPine5]|uniref:Gp30 n=1 Tax=Rhodococcus phage ReqiPine5 TaxID=691963 RepID=D4P805_9CAUD|nr:gp30 [Rhodococcus phage ReqiPine5]ADD81135.1 gp30 [Rhodococcus phage ReqiPine5]
MTGSPRPGTPLRSDADWARTVEERMDDLETGPATRVGDWVFSTDPDTGNLIASHVNGGGRQIAAVPPPGTDPEFIETVMPILKLQCQTPTPMPNSYNRLVIPWDTVEIQIGSWGVGGSEVMPSVTVPEDGVYRITFRPTFTGNDSPNKRAFVTIDGIDVMLGDQPGSSGMVGPLVYDTFPLSAGQVIEASAAKDGLFTMGLGPNATSPDITTSMTIERIR